jgi:hypothetical protein
LELKRDFLKVELTQEEHDEALRQARETKHYHLKKIAYLEKLNAPKVFKSFTAEEIFDLLKSDSTDEIGNVISKGLIIDKDNEEVVRLLTYYYTFWRCRCWENYTHAEVCEQPSPELQNDHVPRRRGYVFTGR